MSYHCCGMTECIRSALCRQSSHDVVGCSTTDRFDSRRHARFIKTLWRLFNSFTEALKGRNLAAMPRQSQALHGLMDGACGLAV